MKKHILVIILLTIIFTNKSYSQCTQPTISTGGPATFCEGANVVLTSSDPGAGYTFQWYNGGTAIAGATSSTYSATLSGAYTVVINNASLSCVSSPSSAVPVTVSPHLYANAGYDINSCSSMSSIALNGLATDIHGTVINGSVTSVTWSSSGTGSFSDPNALSTNFTPTAISTTMTLTLTGICGSSSDQMIVDIHPLSVADFTYVNNNCNQIVNFTNSSINAGNFIWTFGDGTSSSSQNPSHSFSAPGTYDIKLKASNGFCPWDSITKTIVISPFVVANAGTAQIICVNDSVQIGSSLSIGNTFSWTSKPSGFTSNKSQPYVKPNMPTIYYLTTSNGAGCIDQDSVKVNVTPIVNTVPPFNPGIGSTICKGVYVPIGQASLGTGYTYSWTPTIGLNDNTISNPVAFPIVTTVYTVRVTNINSTGCTINTRDTSLTIVVNAPKAGFNYIYESIGDDLRFTNTSQGVSSAITSYSWAFEDMGSAYIFSNLTNPTHQFPQFGTYNVRLSAFDANGCQDSAVATIQRSQALGNVSQANGQPLLNSKVYLLRLNKSDSSVIVIDSSVTSNTGAFNFKTIDSLVYIRVIPNQNSYPSQMPSYYDSSIVFQSAKAIVLTGTQTNANFKTIAGINPGGAGFMSGTISLATGNLRLGVYRIAQLIGANVRFFLMDSLNQVVQTAVTDGSGYFQFSNLALGRYRIWVDKPFVNNSLAPIITLSAGNESKNNMQFVLHKTYLEKTAQTTGVSASAILLNSISIYPNPTNEVLHILFTGTQPQSLSFTLMDVTGKIVVNSSEGTDINVSSIEKGIYFVKIQTQDGIAYKKVVIE